MSSFLSAFVHIKNSSTNRKDAQSHYRSLFLSVLLTFFPIVGQTTTPYTSPQQLPYGPQIIDRIQNGQVYVFSQVVSWDRKQSLTFSIAGKHPRPCKFALRKLARYQDFSQFLEVVKESSYNEHTQEVFFALSSPLLPFNMALIFKLARMSGPGIYPFKFEKGFLNGLLGNIHVIDAQKNCYFYANADWLGPDSGINDKVFAFFTQALGKLVMENLFRISALP